SRDRIGGSARSRPRAWGSWFREYRPIYTPLEAGIEHYLRFDHDFIGREAVEAEGSGDGPARRLVYLQVDPDPNEPADVIGDEPIWHGAEVVGWVTSGAWAHYSERSLALGYVPAGLAGADADGDFEVEIIGRRRPAQLLHEPVLDPKGERMRA
ncbi:MAG: glycine cleavage T C-terminal barrel domain-containing protein, partial [Actinomycetota bacterium]